MYNKLFTKILDSSIWLEPDSTRIVWVTCIAAMDEDGFVQMASIGNLANRANVSVKACQKAIERLEGPDSESSDPDNDGRRLERVQGGWMVLNSSKYRELVTREVAKAQTRERVRKHRANKPVTVSNEMLRSANAPVTPSEADTEAESRSEAVTEKPKPAELPRALKSRPLPGYRRLRIFRWMVEELIGVLGAHLEEFDFDGWLSTLDSDESLVIAETWPWLKTELIAECRRRKLPLAGDAPAKEPPGYKPSSREITCPHTPACPFPGNWQCQQRTVLEAARVRYR